jgi:hypothetical protein
VASFTFTLHYHRYKLGRRADYVNRTGPNIEPKWKIMFLPDIDSLSSNRCLFIHFTHFTHNYWSPCSFESQFQAVWTRLLCGQGAFTQAILFTEYVPTYGYCSSWVGRSEHFVVLKTSTYAIFADSTIRILLSWFIFNHLQITPVATALLTQYTFLLHSKLQICCNLRLLLDQYSIVCKNNFLCIITGPVKRIDMGLLSEIQGFPSRRNWL